MDQPIPPLSFLTIPVDGHSLDDLLSEWRWLVPDSFSPCLLSAFGDQFLLAPNGSVHFLCLLEGTLGEIAPDKTSLNLLLESETGARQWLLPDWVGLAYERHLIRQEGQCYGWRIPPVLGGKLEFANIELKTLRVQESFMGQLHRQLQNRPPGSRITGFTLT